MSGISPFGLKTGITESSVLNPTKVIKTTKHEKQKIKERQSYKGILILEYCLLRNDGNIISSISFSDIVFDGYFGKWN